MVRRCRQSFVSLVTPILSFYNDNYNISHYIVEIHFKLYAMVTSEDKIINAKIIVLLFTSHIFLDTLILVLLTSIIRT